MINRMKIGQWFLPVLLSIGFGACESFLDVKPKAQIKSDALFETEQGFKDALIGVYIGMGDPFAYGKEMTLGMMDVLAQQYEMYTGNEYYELSVYGYNSAMARIDNIWYQLYNCIANLNNLLENIDRQKKLLHPAHYAMIKGEALGLRAFLHFDILRIWGFGDMQQHPEYGDRYTIPYQLKYHKSLLPQFTQKEVLAMIHKDLNEAEILLNAYDPWGVAPKGTDYVLPNEDKFYTHRRCHFNYQAVKATQARVCLWESDFGEALACAQIVIACQGELYPWITDDKISINDVKKKDLSFSSEHIFQLNILDMYENFKWNLRLKAADELNINYNGFYLSPQRANECFEVPGIGSSDYRYLHHFDNRDSKWAFLKFAEVDGYRYGNMMPLIRISEMYYIIVECLLNDRKPESLRQAVKCLNTVRSHRGITAVLPETLTLQEVGEKLEKEYRKEFISEGQLFFYYKRRGQTVIPGGVQTMDDKAYRLPFPEVEMEFGNREDYRQK